MMQRRFLSAAPPKTFTAFLNPPGWMFLVLCVLCSGCSTEQHSLETSSTPVPTAQAVPVQLAANPISSQPSSTAASESATATEATPTATIDPTEVTTTGFAAVDEAPPAELSPGEDWPRFLGTRDYGISGETGLLAEWPAGGPPIVWEKTIGTGYSAPSVMGDQLVYHHRLRFEEIVECVSASTGKPIWKYAYESRFRDPYGYNNGPRCSPLLTAEHCYTFGAEGKLLCLTRATGEKVWDCDTAQKWQIPEAFFGVGSTPVLHGNLLLVMVGGEPDAGVVAFEANTGKVQWEAVNKKTWEAPDANYQMDDKLASYSSMVVAKIGEHEHLLAWMRDGLVSLDPQTGQERFHYFFRSRSFESVNAARPVVLGDQIFLSAAYRLGSALLKVGPDGKTCETLWTNRNLETHWSTPIPVKGMVYGFSGRHEQEAMFRCVDLATGDIRWETDGEPKEPPPKNARQDELDSRFYGRGSAIVADGKFIVLGERGVLALVPVDAMAYREISRIKLPQMSYPSWAAPVLSRGLLYLRDEDDLLCLDLRAK